MDEPAKKAGSKISYNASQLSERGRLEIQAELMDQKSQMEIEKKTGVGTRENAKGNCDRFRKNRS